MFGELNNLQHQCWLLLLSLLVLLTYHYSSRLRQEVGIWEDGLLVWVRMPRQGVCALVYLCTHLFMSWPHCQMIAWVFPLLEMPSFSLDSEQINICFSPRWLISVTAVRNVLLKQFYW